MHTLSFPKLADQIKSYICDNGLRVYILPRHDVPVVTVQTWVATGCIHEQQYLGCGLSHFLEHMSFQGTKQFPGNTVADKVASFGGQINAMTSAEYTTYYMNLPSEKTEDAIIMLDSMLREPLIPEDQFQSEREVILRELAMYKDSPVQNLFEKIRQETFHKHPLRYPIGGFPERLKSLTPAMMREYHDRRYTPGRTSYVVVGDVEPDAVFEMIRKHTLQWDRGNLEEPYLIREQECTKQRYLQTVFPAPQAYSAIAWQTPGCQQKGTLAVEIFADILGNGDSSRLYEALVNRKRLALDLAFCSNALSNIGYSGVIAISEPKKIKELTESIFEIVSTFIEKGPADEEMERVRNCYRAEYLHRLQSNEKLAQLIGENLIYGGSPDDSDDFLPRLNQLTKEDVIRAGKQYFSFEAATVIEQMPEGYSANQKSETKMQKESDPEMIDLSAGQKLMYLQNTALPLVNLSILLPGGVTFENKKNIGISRLLAEVLPAGNSQYNETEFNRLLDLHAIDLSCTAGKTAIQFKLECPAEQLQCMTDCVCAMFREPLFAPEIIERERTALIEELKNTLMTPISVADCKMREKMFAGHVLGLGPDDLQKSISKISRKDLIDFYQKFCLNINHAVIAFSGDLTKKEALNAAEKIRKTISRTGTKLPVCPAPVFPVKDVKTEAKLPREQAIILTAMPGADITSSDHMILELLRADASSMSGRLFNITRNQNGLVYYTGFTHSDGYGYSGCMGYYGGTAPEGVAMLEKIFRDEIRHRITKGFTQKEFDNARRSILFEMDTLHQVPGSLLNVLCSSEYVGIGWKNYLAMHEKLRTMKLAEFNKALKKIFSGKITVTSVVLPSKGKD